MRSLILAATVAALPVLAQAAPTESVRIDMTRVGGGATIASCLQVQRELGGAEAGSPSSIGARQAYDRLGCRQALAATEVLPEPVDACDAMRQRLAGEIAGFRRIDLSEAYARRCSG